MGREWAGNRGPACCQPTEEQGTHTGPLYCTPSLKCGHGPSCFGSGFGQACLACDGLPSMLS